MEHGDASGTGLYDAKQRCFDRSAMDLVDEDLHSCFPDLVGPNDCIGTLTSEAVQALGLPGDVVVAPGSGDNACSALGSGIVE